MQELRKGDIDKLVALQSNKYQKDVSVILDAFYTVLQEAILTGYKVSLPRIGVFSNAQVEPKGERQKYNLQSGDWMTLPAQDAYNRPTFKFSKLLKDKMKEETIGRVL